MAKDKEEEIIVDTKIWKACAGSLIQPPSLYSTVYYFPQGHVEQSQPSTSISTVAVASQPYIICRVEHVSHLADVSTDEVFLKLSLQPLKLENENENEKEKEKEKEVVVVEENDVVSFAKKLTASDANNGGGFSVPRFCADSIFPPLDFNADPPVQNISVRDVRGQRFDFRHIYRGTPRRHLLTTGWSKFVNSKKLVAGDSVVFIRKKSSNELFIGVRRAIKAKIARNWSGEGVFGNWRPPGGYVRKSSGGSSGSGGNCGGDKVVEVLEKAVSGKRFEVVYYPRVGVEEFVVEVERVKKGFDVYWSEGMRVKMAVETEDCSRLQWFQGVVEKVNGIESGGAFRGSVWRMLEVKWDENDHEIMKNMSKVNPWQVEYIPPTPPIHTTFPPTKKMKYPDNSGLFDSEDEFPLPSVGFSSMMGQLSQSYLNHNSFPAGMQGARQNSVFLSNIPNINTDDTRHINPEPQVDNISQRAQDISIDLNIGKTPSDTPSPDSQNSVQLFCTAGTKKAGVTSFQLFGKTIEMEQPLNSTEEAEGAGAGTTMDHPMSDSYKKLHDKLGDQCKRSSVMGGYVNG